MQEMSLVELYESYNSKFNTKNPYQNLANKHWKDGYEVTELIEEMKKPEYKLSFINYFEAVINKRGRIFLAVPSHEQTVIRLCALEEGISIKEMEDRCMNISYDPVVEFSLVKVTFSGYTGKPNRYQKRSIKVLIENGYLDKSSFSELL